MCRQVKLKKLSVNWEVELKLFNYSFATSNYTFVDVLLDLMVVWSQRTHNKHSISICCKIKQIIEYNTKLRYVFNAGKRMNKRKKNNKKRKIIMILYSASFKSFQLSSSVDFSDSILVLVASLHFSHINISKQT